MFPKMLAALSLVGHFLVIKVNKFHNIKILYHCTIIISMKKIR